VNRLGHRGTAAAVALGIPPVLGYLGWARIAPEQALASAVLAVPFSAGRLSPDADQTWLSAFGHRRGVHGWWWPALAGLALWLSPLGGVYAAWGPVIGWSSHLVPADWCFGQGGCSIPRGIPLLPFCPARTGLGLKVSGDLDGHSVLELAASWAVWAVAAWLAWTTLVAVGG
jgi:hypothetical protein